MTSRLILAMAILLAAPAAAQEGTVATRVARPSPLSLSLDIHTHWRLDRGYQLFSPRRSSTAGGVSLGYDLATVAGGTLALAAGWHRDRNEKDLTSAPSRSDIAAGRLGDHARLDVQTLSLSALVRWSPTPWLQPLVRLAADGTWASTSLHIAQTETFEGSAFAPGASAGAGLRLRTPSTTLALPTRPSVAVAGTIEGGFHLGAPLAFDVRAKPAVDEKTAADQIPTHPISLGSLGVAEPYLRVSLAVLF